jgi:hypothetical protein
MFGYWTICQCHVLHCSDCVRLVWLASDNHCISACFFFYLQILNVIHRSMVLTTSVRNYLHLFRWDFIFCQTFPLVTLLSSLSFEFTRVAYLFEMSTCYRCVSCHLAFWDRISPHQISVFLVYLLAFLLLNLLPPNIDQYHGQLLRQIAGMCDIRMLSLINQNMIILIVSLPIRRGTVVFLNVSMWEHSVVDRFLDVAQCTSLTSLILLFSSIPSFPFDSFKVQCDSFGTRPKKMRISQRLFIRFWTCIYDYYIWTFPASPLVSTCFS